MASLKLGRAEGRDLHAGQWPDLALYRLPLSSDDPRPRRRAAFSLSATPRKTNRRPQALETSLHRQLKERYGPAAGGRLEVALEGYRIDAIAADGALVEVQSGPLGPLQAKLRSLLPAHRTRVIKPVVMRRRLIRRSRRDGADLSARLSRRRGALVDVFDDLVGLASLLPHPNLSLDVLAVEIDEVRLVQRRRRLGYTVLDRRLNVVVATVRLDQGCDLWSCCPAPCPAPSRRATWPPSSSAPSPSAARGILPPHGGRSGHRRHAGKPPGLCSCTLSIEPVKSIRVSRRIADVHCHPVDGPPGQDEMSTHRRMDSPWRKPAFTSRRSSSCSCCSRITSPQRTSSPPICTGTGRRTIPSPHRARPDGGQGGWPGPAPVFLHLA